MGNIKQVSVSSHINKGATIQPLSKEKYVLLSTGEVKQIEHHAKDRTENLRNLQKTMKNLSDIINSNITHENAYCCRFVTLTYRENMTEQNKLYLDFSNFNKRFKRLMEKQGYTYEYIVVVEAQERGAFHLHCIFIFNKKAPFIENKTLSEIWKNGFVSVEAINGKVDNVGKYLTAYLSDLPLENDTSIDLLGGDVKEVADKKIIKGARLKLLPVGLQIYRCSRGIKKPTKETMNYGEAVERLEKRGFTKVNEYALEFIDEERDFKTRYIKQTYKKYINKERTEKK